MKVDDLADIPLVDAQEYLARRGWYMHPRDAESLVAEANRLRRVERAHRWFGKPSLSSCALMAGPPLRPVPMGATPEMLARFRAVVDEDRATYGYARVAGRDGVAVRLEAKR